MYHVQISPTASPTKNEFVVTRILAENWDEQSGTVNEGGNIGMFGNDDYLKYNNVNFGGVGSAPKANIIRIAYSLSPNNAADGGTLQAAVQPSSSNLTPTLIGTFQPARTLSWGTYVIDTFNISGVPEGVQSLLFTAVTEENLLNLAWFELDYEETGAPTTAQPTISSASSATSGPGTYRMLPGDFLYPNDFLISQNGLWKLKYQTNGNLVLYDANESQAYWETGTWNTGQAPGYVTLQTDGNLLMVGSPDIGAIWATNTYPHPDATFRIQDDRNLILADDQLLWTPNTYVQRKLSKEGSETMPARELVLATPEEIEAALAVAQTISATLELSPVQVQDHRQLQPEQTYGSFIAVKSVQVWRMPRVASTVTTTTSCGSTYESSKK